MALQPDSFDSAVRASAGRELEGSFVAKVKGLISAEPAGMIKVFIPDLPGQSTNDEGDILRESNPDAWLVAKPAIAESAAKPVQVGQEISVYFDRGNPDELRYRGPDWTEKPKNPVSPSMARIFEDIDAQGTPFAILFNRAAGLLTIRGGVNSIELSSTGVRITGDLITTGTITSPTISEIRQEHEDHNHLVVSLNETTAPPGGAA